MPIGSKFDDFLKEERILETVTAAAVKKVQTLLIQEEIPTQYLTKDTNVDVMQPLEPSD